MNLRFYKRRNPRLQSRVLLCSFAASTAHTLHKRNTWAGRAFSHHSVASCLGFVVVSKQLFELIMKFSIYTDGLRSTTIKVSKGVTFYDY